MVRLGRLLIPCLLIAPACGTTSSEDDSSTSADAEDAGAEGGQNEAGEGAVTTTTGTTGEGMTEPVDEGSGADEGQPSGTQGGGSTTGSAATGGNNLPELLPEDLPDVAPCPSQAMLTDPNMLATLKTAIGQGLVINLDVPFVDEPDIYLRKCGYEEYWDPADNTAMVPWTDFKDAPLPITPTALIDFPGNSGICGTTQPSGFDDIPRAGAYRKEMRVVYEDTTYHVRWRADVTGEHAGETFLDNGINIFTNDLSTAQFTVNGEASSHDDLFADLLAAITTSGELPSATVGLATSEGEELVSVDVTLLCAAEV